VTIDLDGQLEINGTGNSWFAGNVGIGTTDPGGPLEVFGLSTATETLRPNAAGDEESIVYATSGAGNHWQDVNEETADDDTSYVYMAGDSIDAYYRDLYDLPASTGSGTINFIKIYIRARYTNTQGYAKPSLKSGSTTTDGDEITLTNSYVTYSQQWNTNPADGQAWEWTDIDTLQIGVSLRQPTGPSRHTRCTQVYVEVNYNVAKSALVIKASGNVGIGTTGPTGKLQVVGDEVRIGDSGTPSYAADDGDMYIEDDRTGTTLTFYASSEMHYRTDSHRIWDQSATTEWVRIENGNIGIGTTGPSEALDVIGNGEFSGTLGINGTAQDDNRGINFSSSDPSAHTYGIYNTMDTGTAYDSYAIYNSLSADAGAADAVYGLFNNLTTSTTNSTSAFGIYTEDAASTGGKQYGHYVKFDDADVTKYGNYITLKNSSGIGNFVSVTVGDESSRHAATTTVIYGNQAFVATGTDATTQTAYANRATLKTYSGAADVAYGLHVSDLSAATTGGTQYGLYVDLDDANVTNYAIYIPNSESGDSFFGDQVTLAENIKLYFDSTDTYIYANTDNPEDLVIGADQDIILEPDGNVGIGTANPSSFKLEIDGSVGPDSTDDHDLGSDSLRWANLYLGAETLHIGTGASDEGEIPSVGPTFTWVPKPCTSAPAPPTKGKSAISPPTMFYKSTATAKSL